MMTEAFLKGVAAIVVQVSGGPDAANRVYPTCGVKPGNDPLMCRREAEVLGGFGKPRTLLVDGTDEFRRPADIEHLAGQREPLRDNRALGHLADVAGHLSPACPRHSLR